MATRLAQRPVLLGLSLAAACGVFAASADAGTCTIGSSPEISVQQYLNGTTPGVVATQCIANDQIWSPVSNPATVSLAFEFAGYSMQNEFGIYDPGNGKMLSIFAGADGAFSQKTLTVSPSGSNYLFSLSGGTSETFSSNQIGFYLRTHDGDFYSETSKNGDSFDHLLTVKLPTANTYLLGWEDLANGGDKDFNDMGIVVAGMAPVPLPAAAWLMLSGLVGVAAVARRRKAAQAA